MSGGTASLRLPRPFDALPWPPRIDWWRGLAQGAVFGVLPVIVDFPVPTMVSILGPSSATIYIATYTLIATSRGSILAWTAHWVEGRLGGSVIAAVFVIEAFLLAVMQARIEHLLFGLWPTYRLNANFAMVFWLNLAYGSVFFAYCLATQRALRVRGVLARAELERERSATALNEARVDAMAARVDPALLLRVLTTARQVYERQRDGADALLDALVAFLRLAMPAVRSGKSTLLSELALLRAYAALRAKLDSGASICTVEANAPPCDIAFPPLLLVPLVEAAATRGKHPPRVTLEAHDTGLMLTIDAATAPGWMDDTTKQRLERALRSLYPSPEARFKVGASPSLTLWLPLPPTPQEVPREDATA